MKNDIKAAQLGCLSLSALFRGDILKSALKE
ncbi:hypothetical protein BSNT_07025 [Bacillus subtilis subsp. natto BEST195]|nr:hypothetical protein BSNT_07025 [Bacillus subtilis subsp. natto BEST195]